MDLLSSVELPLICGGEVIAGQKRRSKYFPSNPLGHFLSTGWWWTQVIASSTVHCTRSVFAVISASLPPGIIESFLLFTALSG